MNAESFAQDIAKLMVVWGRIETFVEEKLPFASKETKFGVCEYILNDLLFKGGVKRPEVA